MSVASIVARLILGLVFTAAGLFGLFTTPAPMPGAAGAFNTVVYQTHFINFISVAQVAIGILLLVNRYVPVALIMLAAFTYNSFAFHVTMMPPGLFAPVIVAILGTLVALPYRGVFAPIFRARPLGAPAAAPDRG